MCRAIIDSAAKGGSEICTSALSLVEVSKHPAKTAKDGADAIRAFFENDYIVVVPLDRRVGEFARELMQRGYAGLKPPDAAHLACAAIVNADEMHTFDVKLLDLDGKIEKVDGTKLKICKPSMGGPPLPLLDGAETKDETDEEDERDVEAGSNETAQEQDTPVHGSGEGTGMPGGRSEVQPDAEADSGSGAGAEAPTEEAQAKP